MAFTSGVILLAAGSSQRFGRSTPKQFMKLDGEPLFMRSLRVFARHPSVCEIAFVTQHLNFPFVKKWVDRLKSKKPVRLVEGGAYRGESVRNGLAGLDLKAQAVLVHDAARPMVTEEIVTDVLNAVRKTGVALAAWPLPDTLKASNGRRVKKTIPRAGLWVAQTPQGFRTVIAKKCLSHPSPNATDDVELAERRGYPVELVLGSAGNIKVTVPHDLKTCQRLIR